MKKLALGLLLVLGAANVNAANELAGKKSKVVVSLDTDAIAEEVTAEAKGLMAKYPRLSATVAGAFVAYIAYAYNHWEGEQAEVKAVEEVKQGEKVITPAVHFKAKVEAKSLGENFGRPASAGFDLLKGFYDKNFKDAVGLSLGVITALVVYDLAQPDSTIRAMLASIMAKEAAQDAAEAAAAA